MTLSVDGIDTGGGRAAGVVIADLLLAPTVVQAGPGTIGAFLKTCRSVENYGSTVNERTLFVVSAYALRAAAPMVSFSLVASSFLRRSSSS